jgi:hypothetical protein
MDVSIVIVSWNARDYLVKCLRSIEETRGTLTLEVIVVDNASSDGSPEAVAGQFPWVQLIQTGANLGFARGNNVGIVRSTGRYVYLINSDVVLLKGCLQGLVEFMDAHPAVGLAGPRILNADRTFQISMRRSPSLWANWGQAFFLDRAPLLSALFPASRFRLYVTMIFEKRRMLGAGSHRASDVAEESRGRPSRRTTTGRI